MPTAGSPPTASPLPIAQHGVPAVVAVQSANPEVGVVQPVDEVADVVESPLFVDACASAGRLPLPDGWAAAAASAHKWGGPAGVGVLLVRRSARWRNPFPGDERVDERAVGFENVPAALAAAAALRAGLEEQAQLSAEHSSLTAMLAEAVRSIPDTEVFLAPGDRLPHVLAFSCLYVDGEALVTELDRLGFAVASGSACTASSLEPSHVLAAMGALTHGNVRVSLGRDTAAADVHRLADALPVLVERLRPGRGAPVSEHAPISRWTAAGWPARGRSSSWPRPSRRSRWARPWPSSPTTRRPGPTYRRGAACAVRSTPGRGPPRTAYRPIWCGGSAEANQPRCGRTSAAASSPYAAASRATNSSCVKEYSWVPTCSTT